MNAGEGVAKREPSYSVARNVNCIAVMENNMEKWKLFSSVRLFESPMDYTVQGIVQLRILEWVTVPFPRESSQLRDGTQVSRTAGRFFTFWATREAQEYWSE